MNDVIASIIVPVYNSEKTVRRCMDSLIDQTVDNYEIIVVDDGSTDNSGKICDEYDNEKITVIHKKNNGVSSARNDGIDIAKGKYLLFCDSDDYVEKNFVETLCRYSELNNADLICCCFNSINIKTGDVTKKLSGNNNPFKLEKKEFLELRKLDLMACGWDKAYKMSIVKENNIKFNERLSCGEDTVFNLEYLKYSDNGIFVVPDVLYNYSYQLGDNLASKYISDSFFGKYKVLFNSYKSLIEVSEADIDENYVQFFTDFFIFFINCLLNTWDKRNEFGFFKKIIYNHRIVKSAEYKKCFDNLDKSRFNSLYLLVCKSRFALLILAFLKLANMK